jgi:hypothetical protein
MPSPAAARPVQVSFRRNSATDSPRPCSARSIIKLGHLDPGGNTRQRRPEAGRLPARHAGPAHTLPAAPPQAAGSASRHPHGSLDTPVMLRPSPSQLRLTLGLERGMYRGLSCAVGPARNPAAPTRPGPCPTGLRLRLRRERLRRNQCPAQPIGSFAECTFPSLLRPGLSAVILLSAESTSLDPPWLTTGRTDHGHRSSISADLVSVALSAPRTHPPPALVGPVRSTVGTKCSLFKTKWMT